jgi:hypothetical protein
MNRRTVLDLMSRRGSIRSSIPLAIHIREIMLFLAGVALSLGILVNWLKCPRVKLTIFNETGQAMRDVRISFMSGARTAERIEPGGFAVTEIETSGDAGVFMSYRDSDGILRMDEPVYYSEDIGAERGFLEVHLSEKGARRVKGIYSAIDIPSLTVHPEPTGQMTVK